MTKNILPVNSPNAITNGIRIMGNIAHYHPLYSVGKDYQLQKNNINICFVLLRVCWMCAGVCVFASLFV